jgi:hypothetical protein
MVENTTNRCGRDIAEELMYEGMSHSDAWDIASLTHPQCTYKCGPECPYAGQPCASDA